ncbi:facilitated trehalose transporter Tret1-like [Cydia pomonella]|uniref:facilitated trehalose transporter Tret1-like n=1 Tax=Cydia pomonella TaxID=82600 RepID=UPI002ADD5D2A|nr:facilitated trehalose transporter Tret1-like [Cydia pomonella]
MSAPKKSYVPFLRQCFLTASVAVNITGHGCVIGYSAILIPSLRNPDSHIKATPSQESWIASIIGFALIMGNVIVTPLMDLIGRKKCHIISTIPVLAGWFLLLLADSVQAIILARFLQGVSMGLLGPLGSIIISEMTDPKNRGAFLTCVSLSLTIGVMFTHTIGTILSWQQTALLCSFLTFISLNMIIFTTETPSWLIAKGKYKESKEVFFYLRGEGPEQEDELEHMISAQKMIRKSSVVGQKLSFCTKTGRFFRYLGNTFKKPEFYKPVAIMFHLYTLFQFAGINVISSYAMDIIGQLVGPEANAALFMVLLDCQRLLCNVLAVFVMQKCNRRTVLFSMGFICVTAYLSKGTYALAKQNDLLPSYLKNQYVPIFLIGMYMFSLTVGISSVPFAISGEIFPLEYRGLGGGIGTLPLSLNFFVAVKCFPVLTGAIGLPYTYYVYGSVVFYCLSVLWFILPETKDRTLQEIEDELRGKSMQGERRESEPLNAKMLMRRYSSQIIIH